MSNTRRDDWRRVREIFEAALAESPDRRAAFVDAACPGDPAIRDQVAALLVSHEQAADFLETPATDLLGHDALGLDGTPDAGLGRVVGPYRIESVIGHGGMGTVYRARRVDQAFERHVAIKMIRRGMDSAVVIRRFEFERQILASLEHPNIARLLDAGTTDDGVPYFVMELVEGLPLHEYVDAHALAVADRLRLFLRVCDAVQYAHQRLVIHRDLKPSNILVQADGVPKLLDFGIAKLLDPAQHIETTQMPLLTPAYASPEQIRGEAMTTASDVYSLGVLLYLVLTGRSPYAVDTTSSLQLARAVCEVEPIRPSQTVARPAAGETSGARPPAIERSSTRQESPLRLRRRLAGDLDQIVLTALRKEPEARYSSVEQLAEDIRRHLEGKPIAARKGSVRYRAGKFIARHRISVAAAALAMLAAIGGIAATAWQARIARQQAAIARVERARAERRFNDVRKLASSMIFEVHDSIQQLPGATASRKLLVERALEYLDSLSKEAAGDRPLRAELAQAYRKVADVQGNPHEANLGDAPGALASYDKARRMLDELLAAAPRERAWQLEQVRTLLGIGGVQLMLRDTEGALDHYRRALTIAEALDRVVPSDRETQRTVAAGHYRLGDALSHVQAREDAARHLERAIQIYTPLAQDSADVASQLGLVRALKTLAIVRSTLDDFPGSLTLLQEAYRRATSLAAANPLNAALRHEVSMTSIELGNAYVHENDLEAALRSFREAESITASMAAADPSNAQARWMQAIELNNIGDVLRRSGRHAEAVTAHREALTLVEALARADAGNDTYLFNIADTCRQIGETYAAMANRASSQSARRAAWSDARGWLERSAAVFREMDRRRTLTHGAVEDGDPLRLSDRVAAFLREAERELRR